MTAFRTVVVGVADLAPVRNLWQNLFGFEAVDLPCETRGVLEDRWSLDRGAVEELLMLRTPHAEAGIPGGHDVGRLLFVRFAGETPSVRAGAGPTDLCPKNLDVYVDDLPARLPALRAAGLRFRNDAPSEVTAPNGVRFREIHLQGHDDINIVLLQLLDEPMHFSPRGFAGVGALVTIVRDPRSEVTFHENVFDFETVARHRLDGPEIERMIGLPGGSALDITILGGERHLGQLEIIAYEGAAGTDRYPLTRPPARGILGIELGETGAATQCVHSPAGLQVWHPPG